MLAGQMMNFAMLKEVPEKTSRARFEEEFLAPDDEDQKLQKNGERVR